MFEPPTSAGILTVEELDGSVELLSEHDALDGEDVLPGFSCQLPEVW